MSEHYMVSPFSAMANQTVQPKMQTSPAVKHSSPWAPNPQFTPLFQEKTNFSAYQTKDTSPYQPFKIPPSELELVHQNIHDSHLDEPKFHPQKMEIDEDRSSHSTISSGVTDDNQWITVFGLDFEEFNLIYDFFESFGQIIRTERDTIEGKILSNSIHLMFSSPNDANTAIACNGQIIGNKRIGVILRKNCPKEAQSPVRQTENLQEPASPFYGQDNPLYERPPWRQVFEYVFGV